MLLVLTASLVNCAGKKIVLYPIKQTDFYIADNGDICMTQWYFNQVLDVKLEKGR